MNIAVVSKWLVLGQSYSVFARYLTVLLPRVKLAFLVLSLMILVQGMALKIPLVDKKYLDLYRLHKVRCSQTITDILTHDESL